MTNEVHTTPEEDAAISRGSKVAEQIWATTRYPDWVVVGEAFMAGRRASMRAVDTNQPKGRPYNEAFSSWLKSDKATWLAKIDQTTRAALLQWMENRAAIDA